MPYFWGYRRDSAAHLLGRPQAGPAGGRGDLAMLTVGGQTGPRRCSVGQGHPLLLANDLFLMGQIAHRASVFDVWKASAGIRFPNVGVKGHPFS